MDTPIDALTDWTEAEDSLQARFLTGSFVTGVAFIDAFTEACEAAGHHPDVDLRYPHVDITLTTHDVGTITEKDFALAREISRIAEARGISART